MNVSSCSSSVAPPKTTMIASDSQCDRPDPAVLPVNPRDLHDRGDDRHARWRRRCPATCKRDEKQEQREEVGEELHNRPLYPDGAAFRARPDQARGHGTVLPSGGSRAAHGARGARQAVQARPVERGPGVGLAAGRDVAVADDVRDRIAAPRAPGPGARASRIARPRRGSSSVPFELDADREVVAALAALPRGDARRATRGRRRRRTAPARRRAG